MCEIDSDYSNMPQAVAVRSCKSSSFAAAAVAAKSSTSGNGSSSSDGGDDGGGGEATPAANQLLLEREEFLRECRLLGSLQHPHVAR